MKIFSSKQVTNSSRERKRGSILIICLVLAAVGTLGVAAWISLLDARGHLAEQNIAGMDRRIRYRNGKIMAYYTMVRKHLHDSTGAASIETYSIPDGWGSISVSAFAEIPLSTIASSRINKTGARPFRSFTSDVSVGIFDGGMSHPWQYQLKSYNPTLGGELLSCYDASEVSSETPAITGDIRVKGRVVFANSNYSTAVDVKAEQFHVMQGTIPTLSFTDPAANSVKPLNFPTVMQTSGGTLHAGFGNHSSVIEDPDNPQNTYLSRIPLIASFATVNGAYEEITGNVKFANGNGPSTSPSQVNDPVLLARIADLMVPGATLSSEMVSASPLSSAVLFGLINRTPALTEAELRPVFQAGYPLPDDVIADLSANTAIYNGGIKKEAYTASGSSVVADAVGGLWIDYNNPNVPHLILRNFTNVHILGQPDEAAADARKNDEPRAIVISNSDNVKLDAVKLTDYNRRRLVLAVKNIGVLDNVGLIDHAGNPNVSGTNHTTIGFVKDVSVTPFKDWRIICEFEGITADFDISDIQGLNLIGGIRTNHSINVSGGTLTIDRETNPDQFDAFLTRTAWIEAFRVTLP